MTNLRALADSKINAIPSANPDLYLRDQIEKKWPAGEPQMKLRDLTEKDINKDLVSSLRAEGRAKLDEYLSNKKNAGINREVQVLKGWGGKNSLSSLHFARKYRFYDESENIAVPQLEADEEKITIEGFSNDLLVNVLIAAVRGGLIVNCEIDIEPHTHIWREASGTSGGFREPVREQVPVTGRIILK